MSNIPNDPFNPYLNDGHSNSLPKDDWGGNPNNSLDLSSAFSNFKMPLDPNPSRKISTYSSEKSALELVAESRAQESWTILPPDKTFTIKVVLIGLLPLVAVIYILILNNVR
jgi:hypothetical protein